MPADPEKLLEDIRDALKNLPDGLASRIKSAIGGKVQPTGWGKLTPEQQSGFLDAEKMIEDWKAAVKEQREEDKAADKAIDDYNEHRSKVIGDRQKAAEKIPDAIAGVGGSASRALGGLGLDVSPITNAISGVKDFVLSIMNLVDLIKRAMQPIPDEMLRPFNIPSGGGPTTVMPSGAQTPQAAGPPGAAGAAAAGVGQAAPTVLAPTILAPTPYSPGSVTALNVPAGMTGADLMAKAGGAFGGNPYAMGAVPQSLPLPSSATAFSSQNQTALMATKLDAIAKEVDKGEGPGDMDESENVENVPTVLKMDDIHTSDTVLANTKLAPPMTGASGPARPSLINSTLRGAFSTALRNIPHPAARFASIFI